MYTPHRTFGSHTEINLNTRIYKIILILCSSIKPPIMCVQLNVVKLLFLLSVNASPLIIR